MNNRPRHTFCPIGLLYGAPIKLLVDAETAGLNLNNNLTIDGNDHALKFTDKGIALWGHAFVLKDVGLCFKKCV